MKTLVTCPRCLVENYGVTYLDLEIEDKGIYEFTCPNGHRNIQILQLHSFQLLFDLGIMALLDGYTREAVSSFAVSLERFQEYCIDIFSNDLPKEEKTKTWKNVSKQSERQLGAFYFLYLTHFRKTPPIVKDTWVKFRNNVTHKGEIPKFEKALRYAEYIYEYMKGTLIELKEKNEDTNLYFGFLRDRIREADKRMADGVARTQMGPPTFFEIAGPAEHLKSHKFESRLEYYKAKMENDLIQGEKRLF